MRVMTGSFHGKDGKKHTMMFVFAEDMGPAFTAARVKGTGKKRNLGNGQALVWSLTHNAWRTFNFGTLSGNLSCFEADNSAFDAILTSHQTHIANDELARRIFTGGK